MHNHASNQAAYGTTRSAVGAVKGFHSSLNRNHLGGRKRKNVLLGFGHASPDGKQIAFFGGMPGKPWKVYLIAAEGGEPQQLLADELNEGDPSWSPDGASLAFGRLPWKTGTTESSEIYIMDLKSHRRTTVPGSNGLFSPRCSPNGKYLLPTKADSSAFPLFDLVNQKWTILAQGVMGYPCWWRDSNYLYFEDFNVPHRSRVARVRVKDGSVETIADLSTLRQISDSWIGCGARRCSHRSARGWDTGNLCPGLECAIRSEPK